jgi:CheY-like chemotaxis protein
VPGVRCARKVNAVQTPPTILVADDEPLVRHTLRAMLGGATGARILEAADGAEALDLARRELPRIAVLDVEMPGLSGYAVCRALKADPATAHIRVLLFTGSVLPDAEAVGRMAGADGFFRKPLGMRALRARVQALAAV